VIRLKCQLSECIHYHADSAGAPWCKCSHPEKRFYLREGHCPLYRMDWTKQAPRLLSVEERLRQKTA